MKIALVGNQNSGKTTLFNCLTGSNQKVGNWPGVTIDRKEGILKGSSHIIVDLPGIYSLSPYTSEEEVSRKYVFEEKPDLIINIIDATSIERSLYLTTQLLELDCKVIIALNMADMLEKKGITINTQKLSELLCTTIVNISALKNEGIDTLIDIINEGKIKPNNHQKIYQNDIEDAISCISNNISLIHKRFVSVKVLENDIKFVDLQNKNIEFSRKKIEEKYGIDIEQIIANQRYEYIVKIKNASVEYHHVKESMTDKLDKIFLNKWLAIPIFVIIMFAIYFLAVGFVGSKTVDFIKGIIDKLSNSVEGFLKSNNASSWAISLVVDGIIAGVGAVLNFVPQLIILFLCICILETSGYMSRIAFLLDKLFRKFGLSGKSLIPFIVGSGCSVPGIMTARTIEDQEEKTATIMLTPFIPCSAKLPIIALFSGFFFDKYSGLVSASLYFLAIIVILFSAIIMKKFFFKSNTSAFISELPEYKIPSPKYVLRDVFDKTIAFIKRAGTIILLCSIIIWFMLSFSWKFEFGVDVSNSILASIGKCLSWIFYPMLGELSWGATVSAIQGLVAKEQVVSSMSIIAGLTDGASEGALIFNSTGIFGFFNPASAYAFMVFNLFSAPCFGAIGAMRRELGSVKKMFIAILFQTGVAWILAVAIFGIGSLLLVI